MGAGSVIVVGGGPAGLVCGLLLARAGLAVTVLEKHEDFFRDFRGDTVHPSTLALLDELGLGPAFDAVPYSRLERVRVPVRGGGDAIVADLTRLRLKRPYIAMTPQWDFLNVLADAGRAEPTFTLRMGTEFVELLRSGGRVVGVRCRGRDGAEDLPADLVIGCDGRTSGVRADALLDVRVDRLRRWWAPGLLCMGDAAHAMSPAGGVGVNLAVQDGVAAARLLAGPLRAGRLTDTDLEAVQRRREFPARVTQAAQQVVHRGIDALLAGGGPLELPRTAAAVLRWLPGLTAVPAYLVGVGVRPEHAPPFARVTAR